MLHHSASSGFEAASRPGSSSLRLAPWACAARDIPPRPRQTRCVGGPQPPSCPHSGRADLIRATSAGARPMRASHSLEEAAHAAPGPSACPDRGDRAQNSAMGVLIPRHRSSATARSSAGPWEGSSAGTSAAALLEPAPTQAAPAEAWRLELRTRLQPRAVARAATGLTNKVTHWSCSAAAPPQMARYQVLS